MIDPANKKRIIFSIVLSSLGLLVLLSLLAGITNYSNKISRAEIYVVEHRNAFLTNKRSDIYVSLGSLVNTEFLHVKIEYSLSKKAQWFRRDYQSSNQFSSFGLVSFEKTIYFDLKAQKTPLTTLTFYFKITDGWGKVFIVWFLSSIMLIPVFILSSRRTNERHQEALKAKQNAAIAQTTQMLSHDVRRPFSMTQGLLGLLKSSTNAEKTQQLAKEFTPEIEKAIASVNGMIADIMEVGSTSTTDLLTEPVAPEVLIEASLQEVFRYDKKSKIEFTYGFNHKHEIDVHSLKVIRVLSNIIGNAAQAMKHKGQIWFKTKETMVSDTTFIEFCIGNSGSFIPDDALKNLFEYFYTKNKKGGTGLGLAIAKKVVEAHGGNIRCESSKGVGVEFYFTLPASKTILTDPNPTLPSLSSKLRDNNTQTTPEASKRENGTDALGDQLKATLEQLSAPFKILVVDDEPIYQKFISEIIPRSKDFNELIKVDFAATTEEALKSALELKPNIILMDVDLGDNESNGFDVTKKIRKQLSSCKICIHSNRGAFEYQKETIEAGADLFLPKPIGKPLLLKLIISEAKSLAALPNNS